MDFIHDFANKCIDEFINDWAEISKDDLESINGNSMHAGNAFKKGSFVYVAYENDNVLYVGETSKTIKRRFIADGNASHRESSEWYTIMTKVKYIRKEEDELSTVERKLIEQAFSLHFKPKYYGKIV